MNIESLFDLLHKVKMDRPQQQEIEILTDRETAKSYKQLLAVALTNWSRKRKLKYRRRVVRGLKLSLCDHDWKEIDASFDHEFGTEQVFYRECQKCGETTHASPHSYGDGNED